MAILDSKLELSDAQALTTSSSDGSATQSTNVIDLGNPVDASDSDRIQLGAGTPLMLNIRINTAFGGTGPGTLKATLMTNTDSTLTDGTTIIETEAVGCSSTSSGDWLLRCSIPYEALQRYIGVVYTLADDDTAQSDGKVDAWISLDSQSSYGISAEI